MSDLFEGINPEELEKYLRTLNKAIGEEGDVIDSNRLLSVAASYQYYADTREKIVSIVRSIVKNHAFVDGNKRTALVFFLFMSKLGKFQVSLNYDQLEKAFVNIASNNYSVEQIVKMLYSNTTTIEQLREWMNLFNTAIDSKK